MGRYNRNPEKKTQDLIMSLLKIMMNGSNSERR